MNSASGFSLIELLIAMVLGLILTLGIFTFFYSNQRSALLNTEMANMQESVRFALNAINEDIRMAGYQGCADLNSGTVDIIAKKSPSADLRSTVISGAIVQADNTWSPSPQLGTGTDAFEPPNDITPRVGTHTIAIQYAKNPGSTLNAPQSVSNVASALGPLVLNNEIQVEKGELALVSTCDHGEIFTVTKKTVASNGVTTLEHDASQNTRASFQSIYGMPANIAQTRVMPFTTRVYFVADSAEDKADGNALYALYQQTMPFDEDANPPVMLIEGVENMRVLFGIGAQDGQLRYVSANSSAYDPSQIRSVRIGLLMASYDKLLESSDTTTYVLAGASIEPSKTDTTANAYIDDLRLRLAFNTTEAVRNRRAQN